MLRNRLAILALSLGFAGCLRMQDGQPSGPDERERALPVPPIGFPALPYPPENPPTPARIALGRHLFYDARLSRDNSVSCATCHRQSGSFGDPPRPFTFGIDGHLTARNSPTLANMAYNRSYLADGSAASLELQAIVPLLNPLEMAMDSVRLAAKVSSIKAYRGLFVAAYGDSAVDFQRILKAIASFERSLLSGSAPYDRWKRGDAGVLGSAAIRGEGIFSGEKAGCAACHKGFNFTDQEFHNTGLDTFAYDPGRIVFTGDSADEGKFKTPSLRNIALTPPYMHDGRFSTLAEAIGHYNSGGMPHRNRDPRIRPLGLDAAETADLIAFLESLTDSAFAAEPDFADPGAP
jgi:cytochrome c peroxidase